MFHGISPLSLDGCRPVRDNKDQRGRSLSPEDGGSSHSKAKWSGGRWDGEVVPGREKQKAASIKSGEGGGEVLCCVPYWFLIPG